MGRLKEVRPAIVEINLDNLAFNINNLRKTIDKNTLIMAVVKANAYGHGAIEASKVFLNNGAHRLGVSILSEGIELREADIKVPILILNYTLPSQYKVVIEYDLIQSIYNYEDAKKLSEVAMLLKKDAKIHIKLDTGMSRIGFLANDDAIEEIIKISKLPGINIEGIFTHFAKADELDKSFADLQFKRFMDTVEKLEEKGLHIEIKHVSNSAAIIDLEKYRLNMIRPGILLYGYYPSEEVNKDNLELRPAMTLKSGISHIKTIEKGSGVSYNHSFIADSNTKIATLPIGYADGYSRMLTGKAKVSIKGKRAKVVGTICMDQMMIDITDIKDIEIDDEVILFGYKKDEISVEQVADWLGTINYEVICMISRRMPRVYIKDCQVIKIVDYVVD